MMPQTFVKRSNCKRGLCPVCGNLTFFVTVRDYGLEFNCSTCGQAMEQGFESAPEADPSPIPDTSNDEVLF